MGTKKIIKNAINVAVLLIGLYMFFSFGNSSFMTPPGMSGVALALIAVKSLWK